MKKCARCGLEFVGKTAKRIYCSRRCNYDARNDRRGVETLVCSKCGKEYTRITDKREIPRVCKSCVSAAQPPRPGEKNPMWKGGHKYWQEGKTGRDKDGLSWKIQRRLAWERDNYTCQDCSKQVEGWKPDVHHIRPYRLSFSHALDNLKCLCRSCHKRADAKEVELWGGKSFGGSLRRVKREPCLGCGSVRRQLKDSLCEYCIIRRETEKARLLRQEGFSYQEIGAKLGRSHQLIWHWLNSAPIAQLEERLSCKEEVGGSIPA